MFSPRYIILVISISSLVLFACKKSEIESRSLPEPVEIDSLYEKGYDRERFYQYERTSVYYEDFDDTTGSGWVFTEELNTTTEFCTGSVPSMINVSGGKLRTIAGWNIIGGTTGITHLKSTLVVEDSSFITHGIGVQLKIDSILYTSPYQPYQGTSFSITYRGTQIKFNSQVDYWPDHSDSIVHFYFRGDTIDLFAAYVPSVVVSRNMKQITRLWDPFYVIQGLPYSETEIKIEFEVSIYGNQIASYCHRGYVTLDDVEVYTIKL